MDNVISKMNEKMESIASLYLKARGEINNSSRLSSDDEIHDIRIKYVVFINQCFEKLEENEKEIINNEFFFQEYPMWWKDKYSPKSFVKYKKLAIRHFLEVYYGK